MGLPTVVALERLKAAGFEVSSAGSRLSWTDVAAALRGVEPPGDMEVARKLVLQAFETARSSGRPNWQEMTVAVLKNRLLDLTDGAFKETDYAAPTFGYFVNLLGDVLDVRLTEKQQPVVRIKEDALPAMRNIPSPASAPPTYTRLRQDLWRSFFDFRSGRTYVWDVERGAAEAGMPDSTHLLIPTLRPTEEAEWRRDFSAVLLDVLEEDETAALVEWRDKRLGTDGLPAQLRGPWNGYLRAHVEAKIREFFDSEGLDLPSDLLTAPGEHRRGERPSETARLRAFVQRCVSDMTHDELASLPLPAGVVVRVQSEHGRTE